jgi:LysR family malonate utilization transcriptional regulator
MGMSAPPVRKISETILDFGVPLLGQLDARSLEAQWNQCVDQQHTVVGHEDDIFFAAPVGSKYAGGDAVDLRACSEERFVSLGEGFATCKGFVEAFRIASFSPMS